MVFWQLFGVLSITGKKSSFWTPSTFGYEELYIVSKIGLEGKVERTIG
jgi:hypothetical protein